MQCWERATTLCQSEDTNTTHRGRKLYNSGRQTERANWVKNEGIGENLRTHQLHTIDQWDFSKEILEKAHWYGGTARFCSGKAHARAIEQPANRKHTKSGNECKQSQNLKFGCCTTVLKLRVKLCKQTKEPSQPSKRQTRKFSWLAQLYYLSSGNRET